MRNVTFLDLEGTIVESWYDQRIINENLVRAFLDWQREETGLAPDDVLDVELFSFAILNDDEREAFKVTLGPFLETRFNIKFVAIHTCKEMVKEISYFMGVKFEREYDPISMLGKGRMFVEFVQAISLHREIESAALLDDVVMTSEYRIMKKNLSIKMVRIGDMEEEANAVEGDENE